MRVLLTSLVLVWSSSLRVCSSDGSGAKPTASAEATASAAVDAKAPLAKARIGGRVVAVGQHSVELALHQSGEAEAIVSDASGKLVNEGVALSAKVSAKAEGLQEMKFAFSPPRARFVGQAAAGAELTTGPVELTLSVDGKDAKASLAALAVLKRPEFGGSVLVAGDYLAEVLVRNDGEVLAFLRDARGPAVHAAAGLDLSAQVSAAGGASESVKLAFDPLRKCFAGHVRAGVELAPGPVELSIRTAAGVVVGSLERIALRADAAHGGDVLVAGDYSFEVVTEGKLVQVFAFDASGKALAKADAALKLELGAASPVSLALQWDPPSQSYRAEFDGKLGLRVQPIRVRLDIDGKAFEGAAASLRAVEGARLDAKAAARANVDVGAGAGLNVDPKLDAAAKLGADAKLKVPNVKADLSAAAKAAQASAKVNVTAPKVNVSKSASASAGTTPSAGAKAKASAGFSFGIK